MTTPVNMGPWPKGMDNRSPDHSVADDALRNAANVDIDNTGRVRSRAGLTRVYDGHGVHSLFGCPLGTFFVESNVLKRLNANYTSTALKSGVAGNVCYEYANGEVYFSDLLNPGKVDSTGALASWGCQNPVQPGLSVTTGSLDPGTYTVYTVGALASGEESGCSKPSQVSLPNGGGIKVNVGALNGAAYVRVFMSSANGSTGYLQASVAPGTVATITSFNSGGREKVYEVTSPPVAGNIIRYYRGRMYVVSGNAVFYSEPYAFGRFKLQTSFYQFPQNISIFQPVSNGIYCVADEHYFMSGADPGAFMAMPQFPYGAVAGTAVNVPNSNDVMWMTPRGAIRADQDGNLRNLQEGLCAVDPGDTGAAIIREQDGLRQFIASIHPTGTPLLANQDWVTAETSRRASL